MKEVERILRQSAERQRSFPVDEGRWQRLQASLRARQLRRMLWRWGSRSLLLLFLLFMMIGIAQRTSDGHQVEELTKQRIQAPVPGINTDPGDDRNKYSPPVSDIPVPMDQQIALTPNQELYAKRGRTTSPARSNPEQEETKDLPSVTYFSETAPPVVDSDTLIGPVVTLAQKDILPLTFSRSTEDWDPVLPPIKKGRWELELASGIIYQHKNISSTFYADEPIFPGQLVSRRLNGTNLYETEILEKRLTEPGLAISAQLLYHWSSHIISGISLHRWQHNYRLDPNDAGGVGSAEHYAQHLTVSQTQWLSELSLQYRLLRFGRWQFHTGVSVLAKLYDRSKNRIEYRKEQEWVGAELSTKDGVSDQFVRWRLEGQVTYLLPGWQLGLRAGNIFEGRPSPYINGFVRIPLKATRK